MIQFGKHSSDTMQAALSSAGGFVWWYLDLVDDDGQGLALIWFFGLPFLAGSRERAIALERPGVSLALYRADAPQLYMLQEHTAQEHTTHEHAQGCGVPQPDGSCRIGQSRFTVSASSDAVQLRVELDEPIPGSSQRLTGTIEAAGPPCQVPTIEDSAAHCWSPLAVPSRGRAHLKFGDGAIDLAGRAYLDSNASVAPLDALGIAQWSWGRVALPDRELIYYLVDPVEGRSAQRRDLVLTVDAQGRVEQHQDPVCRWASPKRSIYGLHWQRELEIVADELQATVRLSAPVDNGPFYLRFMAEGETAAGEHGRGIAELVAPQQIDRLWQRPFVRMRSHRVGRDNSIWLPLFSGPRRGRVERFVGQWSSALVGKRSSRGAP